jgi:hypothetical protein
MAESSNLIGPSHEPKIVPDEKFQQDVKTGLEEGKKVFPENGDIQKGVFSTKTSANKDQIRLDICTEELFTPGSFEIIKMETHCHVSNIPEGYSPPDVITTFGLQLPLRRVYRQHGLYLGTYILLELGSPTKNLVGYAICKVHPDVNFTKLKLNREGSHILYLLSEGGISRIDTMNNVAKTFGIVDLGKIASYFKHPFRGFEPNGVSINKDYDKVLNTDSALAYLSEQLGIGIQTK